ncbi:MarR family transcriptional regulator [soil metagenome]
MSYSDRESSPSYQLWQAGNAWRRMVNRVLEPLQVTHVQFILMASIQILNDDGAAVTQVRVARFAAIDENMNSQVLRALEKKGLVQRLHSEKDKRAFHLALTEEGRTLLCQAKTAVKQQAESFFQPLGEDSAKLAAMLAKVVCACGSVCDK